MPSSDTYKVPKSRGILMLCSTFLFSNLGCLYLQTTPSQNIDKDLKKDLKSCLHLAHGG